MRSLFITVLVFGILGCKSPKVAQLTGTWLMTEPSREVLPTNLRKADAKIILNANGTFAAYEMPGLFEFPGFRTSRLESGRGIWKLEFREGEQQIQLDFEAIDNWEKTNLPYGTQLNVSTGRSAATLYYFVGDADEGLRVEFKRQ